MRPISERQYEFSPRKGKDWNKLYALNDAIEDAMTSWLHILDKGRPRPIREIRTGAADAIMFTDGSWPEPGDLPGTMPMVGGVVMSWWRAAPTGFSIVVPANLIRTWLPRENQIALVEIFAAVLIMAHFGHELANKRVILLVDSECALDALIKGQSKFSDVIKLVKIFWDLVADHQVDVYLDRVSTDANPSDGLSRGREEEAEGWGWVLENPRFPDALESTRAGA